MAIFTISIFFWKLAKKLLQREKTKRAFTGTRPIILYLRSFSEDKKAAKSNYINTWMQFLYPSLLRNDLNSEEEQISKVFNKFGNFIAIGKPGEFLPQLGAFRLYTNNDELGKKNY